MVTLAALAAVRGQLPLALAAYLRRFVDLTYWHDVRPFLQGRPVTRMFIRPDVVPWRLEQKPESPEDELRRAFNREDDRDRRRPWRHARRESRRIVLLGRPGEGKTLLTQLTARAVARAGLREFRLRRVLVTDYPVPVWLTAAEVLKHGSLLAAARAVVRDSLGVALAAEPDVVGGDAVAERATKLILASLVRPPREVEGPVTASDSWLFVDALDEPGFDASAACLQKDLGLLTCRVVLTCRPYAYLPRLLFPGADSGRDDAPAELELAPLAAGQQRTFIRDRWFVEPAQQARGQQVEGLVLRGHPQFRDLATNALLLTLMCATATDVRRPFGVQTRRLDLYRYAVIDLVRRVREPDVLDAAAPEVDRRRLVLALAAWALFERAPRGEFGQATWRDALTEECEPARVPKDDVTRFVDRLDADVRRSGLLVPAAGRLTFLHPTFFEYLAAEGLARLALRDPARIVGLFAAHAGDAAWREVLLFLPGAVGSGPDGRPDVAGAIVTGLLDDRSGEEAGLVEALTGEAVAEAPPNSLPDAVVRELTPRLLATLENTATPGSRAHVPAVVRARAGTALGRLGDGDPRDGDPRFKGNPWKLPNDQWLGFLPIESSTFHMGSDRSVDLDALDNEFPRHQVRVQGFMMARWPTTVGQFQVFCDDEPFTPGDARSLSDPPNHPVRYVSWHEALRYADWLTGQLRASAATPPALRALLVRGWVLTLPSEAEWEYAARGRDGRIYSYDGPFDPDRGNGLETGIRGPSPVGAFGRGKSPCGVEDLSGNLWEWTRSVYRPYPYRTSDGREDLGGEKRRVVRGGSFDDPPRRLRSAARDLGHPRFRIYYLGFRVVASPFALGL